MQGLPIAQLGLPVGTVDPGSDLALRTVHWLDSAQSAQLYLHPAWECIEQLLGSVPRRAAECFGIFAVYRLTQPVDNRTRAKPCTSCLPGSEMTQGLSSSASPEALLLHLQGEGRLMRVSGYSSDLAFQYVPAEIFHDCFELGKRSRLLFPSKHKVATAINPRWLLLTESSTGWCGSIRFCTEVAHTTHLQKLSAGSALSVNFIGQLCCEGQLALQGTHQLDLNRSHFFPFTGLGSHKNNKHNQDNVIFEAVLGQTFIAFFIKQ